MTRHPKPYFTVAFAIPGYIPERNMGVFRSRAKAEAFVEKIGANFEAAYKSLDRSHFSITIAETTQPPWDVWDPAVSRYERIMTGIR